MLEIARACGETDTWMEISNFHSHLSGEEIKVSAQTSAKFVISSDAHRPERIGSFEKGLKRAMEAGLDPARIVNIKELVLE
jgi:putative hydrolase